MDDIRASFMGLGPVFFYEDEEDLRYLSQAEEDTERFEPNETPGFSTFSVNRDGIQLANATAGSYAPKGSYAMSGGKMYELSRDTRIKGFRGWITLTHSIFVDQEGQAAGAKIAIDGIIDGDVPSAIDQHDAVPVNPNAVSAVYDLSGRKVGTSLDNLRKGMYIVNGKKLLVK